MKKLIFINRESLCATVGAWAVSMVLLMLQRSICVSGTLIKQRLSHVQLCVVYSDVSS